MSFKKKVLPKLTSHQIFIVYHARITFLLFFCKKKRFLGMTEDNIITVCLTTVGNKAIQNRRKLSGKKTKMRLLTHIVRVE